MKAINTNFVAAIAISLALIVLAFVLFFEQTIPASASVSQGSEYQGTTTSAGNFGPDTVLAANQAIGSVIITGSAAGTIDLYDATTSNVNLRTGNLSSSSILLASFPVSAAVGTYTFDRIVRFGLFVHITGTMPTTTITFR